MSGTILPALRHASWPLKRRSGCSTKSWPVCDRGSSGRGEPITCGAQPMSSHSGETTIVRLDADLVNLARAYLSKRAKEPDVIGTALHQRDFETIQRIGHNLHGSGQMFGFGELTRIGAELQRAVVARDGAGIKIGRASCRERVWSRAEGVSARYEPGSDGWSRCS